jgi:TolB-like protein/DNA-binding winged helix-turn-helix (wHTH) protein/tetratricopeptide (TPR) repeat protein
MYQGAKYLFGPFELRTRTRELYKHGVKLKLRPQAYQVLALLLEHSGECVTREELQKRVWPSDTFVDFENGVNTAIKQLRASLSDSAAEPRYIETLPKLGYRMIVAVEFEAGSKGERAVEAKEESAGATASNEVSASPPAARPISSTKRLWFTAAAVSVLGIACLVAFLKWPRAPLIPQPAAPAARIMVAVLPFKNLTGDDTQDYFSDGLTEEMIAQLGRLDPKELGVIARTSVMHYQHSSEKVDQIGSELDVQYVLEGSVRRDSQKVRINAELIEVDGQRQLWAQQYDRELTNLLVVQAEIAREISDSIQQTLGSPQHSEPIRTPTLTPQAYQAYDLCLKGLYFWNKRTGQGLQQAIVYFQQAIAIDPNYAPAFAGLSNTYALMPGYMLAPAAEYMPKAREAAVRALQTDDELPEAHVALALILENYDWDWNSAEKEYRRAIELNPNYATAHHWYAEFLTWQGRFDEALRESESARRLDPLSLIIAADRGAILYFARQYDRSIEQFQNVLEMDPSFGRAHLGIDAYMQLGRFDEALAKVEEWRRLSGDGTNIRSRLVYIYGRTGQKDKARAELRKLEAMNAARPQDPVAMAVAYIGIGNNEAALSSLEKAYAERSNLLTALNVEPVYDPLRQDARFQELLRRVGFAP